MCCCYSQTKSVKLSIFPSFSYVINLSECRYKITYELLKLKQKTTVSFTPYLMFRVGMIHSWGNWLASGKTNILFLRSGMTLRHFVSFDQYLTV